MSQIEEKSKDVAKLLKVISNENRLLILCELSKQPLTVNELLKNINTITQSGMSQHLNILKSNGILDYDKHGQYVTYSIKDERIIELMATLKKLYCN